MKVAICMTSLVRRFGPCWKSNIRHIIRKLPNKPDFYGYFAPTSVPVEELVSPHVAKCELRFVEDPEVPEERQAMTVGMHPQRHGMKGNLLQWLSLKNGLAMVPKDKYDMIIWTRPDLRVDAPIEPVRELRGRKHAHYSPKHDRWRGICDRFCYGPDRYVRVRGLILDYFLDTWYKDNHQKWVDDPQGWNPEIVLKALLDLHQIPLGTTRVCVSRMREDGTVIPFDPKH